MMHQWTHALDSPHQSAGSQQLERFFATLRPLKPRETLRPEKRWRLTWWRWPVELRFRHTTVPRSSSSLILQVWVTATQWTTCHGPASAHLPVPGVSTKYYNCTYVSHNIRQRHSCRKHHSGAGWCTSLSDKDTFSDATRTSDRLLLHRADGRMVFYTN